MIDVVITAVVSLITGAGGMLLFFPQVKRSKILENEAKQSEEWQKLYLEEKEQREREREQWKAEREGLNQKVDSLYQKISEHRDEKAALTKRITELEVENTKLNLLKCEKPNCGNRQPPTGY